MNINKIYCLIILLLVCNCAMTQETKYSISMSAGVTWRSPSLNSNNFRTVRQTNFQTPFIDEKNIQGLSFNPGIRLNIRKVGLEYYPNLRYDVISSDRSEPALSDKYLKEFIVDHNFAFFVRKKVTYGFGASIVNAGKNISYNVLNTQFNPSIQFTTINSFISTPIKNFFDLEFKIHMIPNGYHGYDSVQALLFSIRAYKEFSFALSNKNN